MVGQAPSPVLASEVGPLVVALRRSPLPIALGPWRTHRGSAILAGLATVAALILAAVALPAAHADGFPANPSFEQQGTGWTAIGPAGAVTWAEGRGSVGPGCLRLSNAWAVSDPASPDEQVKGWLRLSFLAQHLEGDASLAVAFVADIDSGPQPQLLLGPESLAAPGWRRVELEAFASPSKPVRLAFGSLGEGAWLIDEVRVQPFQPPACQPPDDAPQLMQTLPDGWEPDGLLDARARTLGTERELIVLVNGIEVSMPERVQVKRAHRRGLRIYAENRGRTDKQLTIAVQAPRGFYVPHRTVPIRGGTTLIDGSVQSLLTGRYLLRIEFRSADEVKAAPLVVECERSYPAFGAAWVDRPPTPAQLEATIALPLQLHQVPVSALSDDAQAQGLFVDCRACFLLRFASSTRRRGVRPC